MWPGDSVFPDFFIDEGINLWKKGLNDYNDKLNYDGMWIDMNEPGAIEIFPLGNFDEKLRIRVFKGVRGLLAQIW